MRRNRNIKRRPEIEPVVINPPPRPPIEKSVIGRVHNAPISKHVFRLDGDGRWTGRGWKGFAKRWRRKGQL